MRLARVVSTLLVALALTAPLPAHAEALGSQLLRAAYAGEAAHIEGLLAQGADLEASDERGYTPLIWAAQQGYAPIVALLLAHGARPDPSDQNGYTALIWAAQQGYAPVVARLLRVQARLDLREKHGYTALDWAARAGHLEVVKLLVAAGADPGAHLPGGPDARELARRSGQAELIAFLAPPAALRPPVVRQPAIAREAISWSLLGSSAGGAPIPLATLGHGRRAVLLIASIHGDEPQGTDVIERLLRELESHPARLAGGRLLAVPVANPDGVAHRSRGNARGVDLNRNFPASWQSSRPGRTYGGPAPLSEPETRALLALIERERPALIVSFHAHMRCNNFDGDSAMPIAREMARRNGYPLLADVGYPTPGSLGHHASRVLGIPIVTLETGLEGADQLWSKVRESLILALAPLPEQL